MLTRRETEVLRLAAAGLRNKEIAARLEISPNTVRNHLASAARTLGMSSRTQMAMCAVTRGLVDAAAAAEGR